WRIWSWTASGGRRNERSKTVPGCGRHRLHAVDNVAPKKFAEPGLAVRNSVQPTIHHNSHDGRTILRAGSNRLTPTGPINCWHGTRSRRNLVSSGDEVAGLFRREPGQPARLPARHRVRGIILRVP